MAKNDPTATESLLTKDKFGSVMKYNSCWLA
jgi:hypothetical protein